MRQDSFISKASGRVPRGLWIFSSIMLLAGFGLIAQRDIDAARRNSISEHLIDRNAAVPNAKHVWWAFDLFSNIHGDVYGPTGFGTDYIKSGNNWSKLCPIDSNGDGVTNGQHLGDPCCRWKPSNNYFDMQAQQEYRRWHLSHPMEDSRISLRNMNVTLMLKDTPTNCDSSYDASVYKEQFLKFYFFKADSPAEEAEGFLNHLLKGIALTVMVAIFMYWIIYKDLLIDLLPWTSSRGLTWRARITLCVCAFFYMDLTSGIVHLVLDYAPFHLPGLGVLAKGFQFHHHDPTAIIRISWFEYASHIHFLCPLIQTAVVLSGASRSQRYFWFWSGVWAHLFQTAHRWAHMPHETLHWIVRALMNSGLLLSHELHMAHHEDLEHQFTILSGHTDVIVDNLSLLVPPSRYDLWSLFGVIWFLFPIFFDVIFRELILELQGPDANNRLDKVSASKV